MDARDEADKNEFHRQLEEAHRLREFAYSITEGKHQGNFERKDYIAFALFNRCLQTHEAAELVVKQSLIDDMWVLVRALVEHTVNAVYMLYVADFATADNFNDYQDYLAYKVLLDLKGTDEPMLRQLVSAEEEEKGRRLPLRRFEIGGSMTNAAINGARTMRCISERPRSMGKSANKLERNVATSCGW